PMLREPVWDGASLWFAVEDSGNTHVYRVPADASAEPERVVGGDAWVSLFDGERQVTSVGEAFTSARELSEPERFVAVSDDGTEVEAWIMRPVGFQEG